MKFFGTHYRFGAQAKANHVATPVGALCGRCDEPIGPQDSGWLIPYCGKPGEPPELPYHRACFLRGVIGSVAHQQHRCSCYVQGSVEEDDPTLTPRQAAEAALAEFEKSSPQLVEPSRSQRELPPMSSDTLTPGAVYLDLDRAPTVQFTVQCPSCLKTNVVEVDCSVFVFDAIALWCPCGVQTDISGRTKN